MDFTTLRTKTLALYKKTETAKKLYEASLQEGIKSSKCQLLNIQIWKDVTTNLAGHLRHALTLQRVVEHVGYLMYTLDNLKDDFTKTEAECVQGKSSADDALKKGDYTRLTKISSELQVKHAKSTALLAAIKEIQPLVAGFSKSGTYKMPAVACKPATVAVVFELDAFKHKRQSSAVNKSSVINNSVVNFKSR